MFKQPSLLLLVALLSISTILRAQHPETYSLSTDSLVNFHASQKKVYHALRLNGKIKIDGKLDEFCWIDGTWSGGFIQQQPLQAKSPSQDTEVCIYYDDRNLYVGIKCYDNEPESIHSILSRRDEFNGDIVGIALDSYNDNRSAFEFNVSAAGQKVDLVHLDAYQWDYNWDAVWDGKTSITDSLWIAELRIPFSQLRFAKADEQIWGMHIWRWIDRLMEEDQWKLIPVDAPEMVYLFGELRGIKGINPKRKLEIMPYTSAKFSPNSEYENKSSFALGVDGKIGLSSDFTLDYTVNPDFGQVEADPSILSLSSYEVFYDEKRPFFLEGNNILDYNMGRDLLFYSRRIGKAPEYFPEIEGEETVAMPDNTSILSALKVTGKSKNGLSIGAIQSFTAKENAIIYSGSTDRKEAIEPFTNYFIGRIKQDYNEGNTVLGGMLTSVIRDINNDQLDFLPGSSFAGGLDFQHNWMKRKYFVDVKTFFSQMKGSENAINRLQLSPQHYYQRADAEHLNYDPTRTGLWGHGGEIEGGKRSGKFRATGAISWRSPGIDLNDVGYLRQADFIQENVELLYKVNKPNGILRDYWCRFQQLHSWSYGGENTKDELGIHSFLRFTNLWQMHLNLERDFNVFDTRELRGGPKLYIDDSWDREIYIQSNSSKDLMFAVGTRRVSYDDNISKRDLHTFFVRWHLNDHVSLSSRTKVELLTDHHQYVQKVGLSSDDTGYLVGTLDRKTLQTTIRLEYFITPELSLQYYANPYASVGSYDSFRRVIDASDRNIDRRYLSLTNMTSVNGAYTFVENDGEQYSIPIPNFNYRELRSNLVARWEFRPGSTLYLVWNSSSLKNSREYESSVIESFGDIFGLKSQNVFMIKFNYWFSL
ncbi:DUF5916 domain-containing protein [Sunxiuqinia sp. A32]|uniref:DUF5916 domain-containing protein n=1 Tax=Sunxiuqinia sp. A32 TaxID=3461496 RepID=UPI00404638AE